MIGSLKWILYPSDHDVLSYCFVVLFSVQRVREDHMVLPWASGLLGLRESEGCCPSSAPWGCTGHFTVQTLERGHAAASGSNLRVSLHMDMLWWHSEGKRLEEELMWFWKPGRRTCVLEWRTSYFFVLGYFKKKIFF